jgi:hypothetical protein
MLNMATTVAVCDATIVKLKNPEYSGLVNKN